MARTVCPVCKVRVPGSAFACQLCGRPVVPTAPPAPPEKRPVAGWLFYLLAGSGILVFIGSFLPWATWVVPSLGSLHLKGIELDGEYTLLAGVVMFGAAFACSASDGSRVKPVFGLASAAAIAVATVNLVDVRGFLYSPEVSIGYGLWVVLAGGVAGVVALFFKWGSGPS